MGDTMSDMDLSANSFCPAGKDCRIRDCGCRDLVPDLQKILKMLSGNQTVAAWERMQQMCNKFADRECINTLGSTMSFQCGTDQDTAVRVDTYLKQFPESDNALCLSAALSAKSGHAFAAVEKLQSVKHFRLRDLTDLTLGLIQSALLKEGASFAFAAHYRLARVLRLSDEASEEMFQGLHPLYREPSLWQEFPAGMYDSQTVEILKDEFVTGKWRKAAERIQNLLETSPRDSLLWYRLGACFANLGDTEGASQAWRECVAVDNEFQRQVVVQALQILVNLPTEPLFVCTVPLNDHHRAIELLSGHPHLRNDRSDRADKGHAKALFVYRGCPKVESPQSYLDLPAHLVPVFVYGKTTSEPGRIEFSAVGQDELDEVLQQLQAILGEVAQGDVSQVEWKREPCVLLKNRVAESEEMDLPKLLVDYLSAEWTESPCPLLGGDTPADVAKDPSRQIELAAVILLIEKELDALQLNLNALRTQLGVPERTPYKLADPRDVPFEVDLDLYDLSDVDSEWLERRFYLCVVDKYMAGVFHLAEEIRERGVYRSDEELAYVFSLELDRAENPSELFEEAIEIAARNEISPAICLLSIGNFALFNQNGELLEAVVSYLFEHHRNEPRVAEWLQGVASMLDQLSSMAQQAPNRPSSQPEGLWTPEGSTASQNASESKLWLPD